MFLASFVSVRHRRRPYRSLWMLLGLLALGSRFEFAVAHEGHDHGPPAPPPTARATAPRLYAASPDLELVAILDQGELQVWLDGFRDNRPVDDARIEVEGEGLKRFADHQGGGRYSLSAEKLASPGRHELIFTIESPAASDLLLGTLEVPVSASVAEAPASAAAVNWYETPLALQGIAGFLAVWVLILLAKRDRRGGGGLGLAVIAALLSIPPNPAQAHGGEDHSHGAEPPAVSSGDAPVRLADGSLFVPKPAQHLIGLRTAVVEAGEWRDAFALNGHVIADPGAGGLVQAPLRGRIVLAEGGLPIPGAPVVAGQVLAWLEPILDAVDHTTLRADLAELNGKLTIAERSLERLRRLGANASRQDLDQAETEYESLTRRRQAISESFQERRPLAAPAAGVIASIDISPGRIVEGGETLFTVVDPNRLWVEALLYDTAHATHFVAASGRLADGAVLRLTPLGNTYALRGHALPLQFRIEPGDDPAKRPHLTVGLPVEVFAEAWHTQKGLRIPSVALQRGAEGEERVWLHTGPESFRSVRVRAAPLDAQYSLVSEGIAAGDRVVTEGASLLGQVR